MEDRTINPLSPSCSRGVSKGRLWWYDARTAQSLAQVQSVLSAISLDGLVISLSQLEELRGMVRVPLVVNVEDEWQDISALPDDVTVLSGHPDCLQRMRALGRKVALQVLVDNRQTMDDAWRHGALTDYLVVELADETNIPLELLLARLQSASSLILKVCTSAQEAEIAMGVMDCGVKGTLIRTKDPQELKRFAELAEKLDRFGLQLHSAEISEITHVGMGHRACIDTTTLMQPNEGMIVGSTSLGGFLVSSETHYLPYMELRPFRVNAGAVHSYIWARDGETRYLSELRAGSQLLRIDTSGEAHTVIVGRVKMERRPLLKIAGKVNETPINVIVQDDWHIRLFGPDSAPVNASQIKTGDKVLAYLGQKPRHVGIAIDEELIEQ